MDVRVGGFLASGIYSGIKEEKRPDLGLIYSKKSAICSAVFTKNRVKAAPIIVSKMHLEKSSGYARAIIVNSGNANACTGKEGIDDAIEITDTLAKRLGIDKEEILICSTGVIGKRLEVGKISSSIPDLIDRLSEDGIRDFANAIMTTDTFPKISIFRGDGYSIVGVAKGAGMIMPDMATMLCFILTDLKVDKGKTDPLLKEAVDRTFNRITVDGDTSTNDTVILMANGASEREDMDGLREGLFKVCSELSRMIVKDGEGASKLVEVIVKGAKDPSDAEKAARGVANSLLVKTAIFGGDPNWGRIMASLGRSGAEFDPEKVDIWIEDVKIVSSGKGVEGKEEAAAERMKRDEFKIVIDLKNGNFEDRILTCDLTYDYIRINAEYRT